MSEATDKPLLGQAALARVAELRKEARLLECATVREALIKANGSERGAAKLLDVGRDVFRAAMQRHPELPPLARTLRVASGGHPGGGNPNLRKATTQGV